MKILVLGAYGFIGSSIMRALAEAGHEVVGLGRSVRRAAIQYPDVAWVARDLRAMLAPGDWHPLLQGMDAVVNAAGVLQDGADDDVAAVQSTAMRALFAACADGGPRRIVQISAVGAEMSAPTLFMATKAEADAALAATDLDWIILRPGLVLGEGAYGASALLRGLAAFPFVLPVAMPAARLQTVALGDVAAATRLSVEGRLPWRSQYDLVEDETRSLQSLILALRAWLGLPPAPIVFVPTAAARLIARCGDLLGRLGWRPPLRSTALCQIEASITGDTSAWREATGRALSPLHDTLRSMPSTAQEQWFARMWLAKPLIIATLAAFWVFSGLVALAHFTAAEHLLTSRGVDPHLAAVAVGSGSGIDILLGLGVLLRRMHRVALAGMLATAFLYLGFGTLLAPELWSDPLGPFVKVLPSLTLTLVALAIAQAR